MKALIIAAGGSTRLRPLTSTIPKTLVSIGEKKILDFILDPLVSLNLEILIVTGYHGKKIKRYVKKHYEYDISFIHNSQWKGENGVSVLRAEELLKNEDKFLLLMSDHIFDPSFLDDLVEKEPQECYLCVDRNVNDVFALKEATKIYAEKDKILNIGKRISYYNGVDCGIFLTTPYIFDILKENVTTENTLNNAMKRLCTEETLYTYDVTGNFWIDIDTEIDVRMAYEFLKTYGWNSFQTYK